MRNQSRPRRDFSALRARRLAASALFQKGKSAAEVARLMCVSRQSTSLWHRQWRERGRRGLYGAGRAGRKPRLDPAQIRQVEKALLEGAQAHGFANPLWTLPRLAGVIEKITGVAYHPGHVWRVMREMGWSLQRPARRARERDERSIERWKRGVWPRVKKTPKSAAPGSSSRTKAASPRSP